MTPVYQTRGGKEGNCWAACLATVFDATLEEADPCACNNPDWLQQTEKFLAKRGYAYVEIRRNPDGGWPITTIPAGTVCVLGVRTNRGMPHVIVVEVFHDTINGQHTLGFNLVHDPLELGKVEDYTHVDSLICFLPQPSRLPARGRLPELPYCEAPKEIAQI